MKRKLFVSAVIGSILVLSLVMIKSINADDIDTMGVFCRGASANETIKSELVDHNFIDKKYSNETCAQIDSLIKSGKVEIDQVAGLNGLLPYVYSKGEQNQTQNQTLP